MTYHINIKTSSVNIVFPRENTNISKILPWFIAIYLWTSRQVIFLQFDCIIDISLQFTGLCILCIKRSQSFHILFVRLKNSMGDTSENENQNDLCTLIIAMKMLPVSFFVPHNLLFYFEIYQKMLCTITRRHFANERESFFRSRSNASTRRYAVHVINDSYPY